MVVVAVSLVSCLKWVMEVGGSRHGPNLAENQSNRRYAFSNNPMSTHYPVERHVSTC